MVGIAITLQDADLEELNRRLNQFQNLSGRFTGLYDMLTALGESQTRRRIESGRTSPEGVPWKPWSPTYAKSKRHGPALLQKTGALLDSLTAFVDGNTAGWGTNLSYAATHQLGDSDRNIPARPFLGVGDADLAEFYAAIEAYLEDTLR